MKIAILYIALGKYDVFWKDFYVSSEKYFLFNYDNDYFIFTDSMEIFAENNRNVKKIKQNNLGWPGNTLYRFKMFESIKEVLKEYDYIFFFNANYIFIKKIGEDFLPNNELLVVQHPGYYNVNCNKYPYEKNHASSAFVEKSERKVYVQGCLEGGTSKEFIEMISELNMNVDADSNKGIVAKWHDESHLNKYICSHKYKLLDPGYAYPEGWDLPFEKNIMTRDKSKYTDYDTLRGVNRSNMEKAIQYIKNYIKRRVGR